MKKIITTILIAAAAFTACVQNDEIVVNNNDKISFTASFDAPQTRSVLVNENGKFHAEWAEGDRIELFEIKKIGTKTTRSSNPIVNLTAGGPTASVEFELAAQTADEFTYIVSHNDASMQGEGLFMAFTLPATQAPQAMNTFDSATDLLISKGVVVAAQPTTGLTFELKRVTAIGEVTVKNLALAADDKVVSVTFSCSEDIAGKRTKMMVSDIAAGNDPLTQATVETSIKGVTVTLPEAQTGDFTYYMNVWPATLAAGSDYTVTITTEKDTYIKQGTLPSALSFTSGNITALKVNMSGVKGENESVVEGPKYVEVAGIKWATGNLQYQVGGRTSDGFNDGWAIAANQAHFFGYESATSGGATLKYNEKDKGYNKVDHFNFGGITDYCTVATASAVSLNATEPAFDFSGKMYTDQTCTSETKDFAAAKYGDIAYWASNGKYRMPTGVEFNALYNNACRTKATYILNGTTLYGTYFYNPGEGETAGVIENSTPVELSDDDLHVGLFLPYAGRGYNTETSDANAEEYIFKAGNQGVYRVSTVNSTSTLTNTHGLIYRIQSLSEGGYYNTAYGATARYSIRPVYIAE